jgi:hypothetical protein
MWKSVHTFVLFLIVPMVAVGAIWLGLARQPLAAWLYTMGLLLVFLFVCGQGITGRWAGALIDDRTIMSRARRWATPRTWTWRGCRCSSSP